MHLSIIGATGFIGSRLVAEALRRCHKVTAISRHPAKAAHDGLVAVVGDTRNPEQLATLVAGSDACAVAVRWSDNCIADVLSAVRASGVPRVILVIGAGSLLMPDGRLWLDHMEEQGTAPPTSRSALHALEAIRPITDLDWVAVSPSADIQPGERTRSFRLGGDALLVGPGNRSRISCEDFAVAIIDEAERPTRHRERFTVGY